MEATELIRSVRVRRGLTQVELAQRAGTSQPAVSAYEHGRRDPTFTTLRRLVAAGGERLVVRAVPVADGPPPALDDHERAERLVDVLLLADAVMVAPRARATETALRAPRMIST